MDASAVIFLRTEPLVAHHVLTLVSIVIDDCCGASVNEKRGLKRDAVRVLEVVNYLLSPSQFKND